MEITLNWLINKSSLEDIQLLTCPHMLSTPITGVNIMDNPDTVQWIKPGELILTTGYVFVDNPPLQIQILKDLKKAGCAGLCLKTKRFLQEIPEHMIAIAKEIELPLIELPYYYSLAYVSDEIRHQIFLLQFEEATAEQQLFNTLFNSYFQGKSLNEILKSFSDYIKSSVLILSNHTQAPWFALTDENTSIPKLIPPFSSVRITRQKSDKNDLYFTGIFSHNGQDYPAAFLPFSTPKYTLCIIHEAPEILPWNTISHVLKIIDFSRMNTGFRHTTVTNYYDSFFQYLMNPENFSETSAIQLCEYYGIPLPSQAICIVFRSRKKEEHFQPQKIISLIKNNLHSKSVSASSYFTAYNQNLVCLCLFSSLEKHATNLRETLLEIIDASSEDYIVGISRQTMEQLPTAFQEASFMLSLYKYFPEERAFFFQDYLIFWQIFHMSEAEKQSIYTMTVQPLIQFDRENHTNLTETLWMYFSCHLNSSLAASKLFIHRNTFLKRMEKIKNLLNFSTEHPSGLFSIYLGLCIHLTLN